MSKKTQSQSIPIAIVGISSIFPGSSDVTGYWRNILEGKDLITDIPPSHWLVEDCYDPDPFAPDKTYSKRGGFISEVDFDPMEFGIPPTNIPSTDTSQLLALIVAKQVLEDAAQGRFNEMDRDRISVILGVTSGLELLGEMAGRLGRPVWIKSMRECGVPEDEAQAICDHVISHSTPWKESTFPGLLGNVVAGRIANRFDLGGTNCCSDAACASSFSALSMGINELYLGQSDLVITGGVDTLNNPFTYICFSKTPALSFTDDCRPFSDDADGMMLGEGVGMVALKRLEDAERDGDRIYAVLRGLGSSSDGRATSVYSPLPEGQIKALQRCYKISGFNPDTVELMEGHGTATIVGDTAEFEAIDAVFNKVDRKDRQWCALGSVKSQIGHTKGTAAVAGLIKAVMALRHKVLPPTIKVNKPHPKMDFVNSAFYLNTETRPWIRDKSYPRRAAVSSFGFGGTNFHITLEEYKGPGKQSWRLRTHPSEFILLGAEKTESLVDLCKKSIDEMGEDGFLTYLARTTQENFKWDSKARLAITATNENDLKKKLRIAAETISKKPGVPFSFPTGIHYADGVNPGSIAFLFPGQGSHYLAMGADLAMNFDEAQEIWNQAASMKLSDDIPLHQVVFPKPVFSEEERDAQSMLLTATQWAQPSISATSLSMLAVLKSAGIKADCVGGHSLGEITALFEAGVLDMPSLLKVTRKRGELMAEAASIPGAMTAVACPLKKIRALLSNLNSEAIVANYNSPNQLVLSGPTPAIEKVEEHLAKEEIMAHRLRVSTAFHSSIMNNSCGPFHEFLEDIPFSSPNLSVYSNADAAPYPDDVEEIRALLTKQISHPVRFVEQVEAMFERGVRTFIEVGPGSVLTNLVGQCLEGRPHIAVNTDRKGENGITSLWNALGRLAVNGVKMDFAPLWKDYAPLSDPREKKKPKHVIPIMGCNYDRAYPPAGGAEALPKPNPPRSQLNNKTTPILKTGAQSMDRVDTDSIKNAKPGQTSPDKTDGREGAKIPAVQQQGSAIVTPDGGPVAPRLRLETNAPNTQGQIVNTSCKSHQPTATNVAVQPLGGNGNQLAWIKAYQEIQQQTAETYSFYLKTMGESQIAFLKAAESSTLALGSMLNGRALPEGALRTDNVTPAISFQPEAEPAAPFIIPSAPTPPSDALAMAPAPLTGLNESFTPAPITELESSASVPATPLESSVSLSPAPTVSAPDSMIPEDINLEELMLSVVVEKTGYPKEILTMDMNLESDLGIDSIKRVEILSAIKEQAPWLPEVDIAEIANIQTLGEVLAYMEKVVPSAKQSGAEDTEDKSEQKDALVTVDAKFEAADITSGESKVIDITPSDTQPLEIGRYVLSEVPAPHTGFSMRGLTQSGLIAITNDNTGVAHALVEKMKERGLSAEVVDDIPDQAGVVIFLGGLREFSDEDSVIAVNREAFLAAKKVAEKFASSGGVFVTVQDTGGDFGLSGETETRVWLGGLPGLVKSAGLEWPKASVKAIDLERGDRSADELAEILTHELFAGGPEIEIGLHADGTRIRLECCAEDITHGEPMIDDKSIIVASGGARGVTSVCLTELARQFHPRLVLLGRTPLVEEPLSCQGALNDGDLKQVLLADAKAEGHSITPAELGARTRQILANREIRSTLKNMQEAGSDVKYLTLDVQDTHAVTAALESIRQEWGPITGIIHGAGVLADKLIAEKTPEQFDFVFKTKVDGLRSLLSATAKDPLKVICLFSSVAARFGNRGQCDYAMANEVLNKIADLEARRRGGACLVKSLNWGPWDGGMVSPFLKTHMKEMGIPLIPLEAGARKLVDEIGFDSATEKVEVVIGPAPPQEGLSIGDSDQERNFSVLVNSKEYPFLESHRIKDVPVVPVVMVLEWLSRAAHFSHPDMTLATCKDLRVQKGIQLKNFQNGGDHLTVRSRQISKGDRPVLAMELPGTNGASYYTATVEMAKPGNGTGKASIKPNSIKLKPWSLDRSKIYNDQLFHGLDFQVLRSLEGVSDEGAAAILAGTEEMGWPGDCWKTDAAAFDGGLQLALLWGVHMLGRPSLPTKIGTYINNHDGVAKGPIRCELQGKVIGNDRTVSDLSFFDKEGNLLAEMREVEMHMLPDNSSFKSSEA